MTVREGMTRTVSSRAMRFVAALVLFAALPLFAADPREAALDDYVRREMHVHLVPGLAYVVVEKGEIAQSGAFGNASRGAAMTIDTPIIIGSLSKAFTATALLQLVEEGKVDLDAPVTRYVPWFRTKDAAASSRITVRQILNQTSGLPTMTARASGANPRLEDHVRALADADLAARPGERHIYASPNYQLAGYIVERVSGMSFGTFVEQRIFRPLGMTRSFVSEEPARAAGLATGHNLWFGLAVPSTYRFEPDRLPTASIITTTRDLSRFAASHLGHGPQLLSPAMLEVAHRGAAPAGSFSYAMGWRAGKTAGADSLWHGGALPSYRGAVVLLPGRDRAVVVLTNSSSMFADHTREIASGIVALTEGQQPPQLFRPLRRTYQFVALFAAIFVVLQLRSLAKSRSAAASRRARAWAMAFDFALPAVLLVFLPRMTKVPWRAMWEGAPDVVTFLGAMALLSLASGVVKLTTRSARREAS